MTESQGMKDRGRINVLRELCEILIQNVGKCEEILSEMEGRCKDCPKLPAETLNMVREIKAVKDYIDEVFVPSVVMSEDEQKERDLKEQRRSDGTVEGQKNGSG